MYVECNALKIFVISERNIENGKKYGGLHQHTVTGLAFTSHLSIGQIASEENPPSGEVFFLGILALNQASRA